MNWVRFVYVRVLINQHHENKQLTVLWNSNSSLICLASRKFICSPKRVRELKLCRSDLFHFPLSNDYDYDGRSLRLGIMIHNDKHQVLHVNNVFAINIYKLFSRRRCHTSENCSTWHCGFFFQLLMSIIIKYVTMFCSWNSQRTDVTSQAVNWKCVCGAQVGCERLSSCENAIKLNYQKS